MQNECGDFIKSSIYFTTTNSNISELRSDGKIGPVWLEKRKKYLGSGKWIQSIVHDFVDMST